MAYLNYNISLLKTIREALLEALRPTQENLLAVAESRLAPADLSSEGAAEALGSFSLVGRFSLVRALNDVVKVMTSLNNSTQLGWEQQKVSDVAKATASVIGQVIAQSRAAELGQPAGPLELMRAWTHMNQLAGLPVPTPVDLFDGDADIDPSRFSPMDAQTLRNNASPHLEALNSSFNQLMTWPESDSWENIITTIEGVFDWAYALRHRLGFHSYLAASRARIAWELLHGQPDQSPEGRARLTDLQRAMQMATSEMRKFSEDQRRSRPDSLLEMIRPLLKPWPSEWTSRSQALSEATALFNLAEFWRQTSSEALNSSASAAGPSATPLLRNLTSIKNNWSAQFVASSPDYSDIVASLSALTQQYDNFIKYHEEVSKPGQVLLYSLSQVREYLASHNNVPPIAHDEIATMIVIVEDTLGVEEMADIHSLNQRAELAARRVNAALRNDGSLSDLPQPTWSRRRLSSMASSAATTAATELSNDLVWIIDVIDEYYRRDPEAARQNYDECRSRVLAGMQVLRALGQNTAASIMSEIFKDLTVLTRPTPDINGREFNRLTASLTGVQTYLDAFASGDPEASRLLANALEALSLNYSLDRTLSEFHPKMRQDQEGQAMEVEDSNNVEAAATSESHVEQDQEEAVKEGQPVDDVIAQREVLVEDSSAVRSDIVSIVQESRGEVIQSSDSTASIEVKPDEIQADDVQADVDGTVEESGLGDDFSLLDEEESPSVEAEGQFQSVPEVSEEPEEPEYEGMSKQEMDDLQAAAGEAFRNNTPWTDRADDEEMVDAFVEETLSVFAQLEDSRIQCLKEPNNKSAMETLRRQFHTIKGSGRIAGLWGVGEYAAYVENRMNVAKSNQEAYSEGLNQMVRLAGTRLSEFLGELSREGSVEISSALQKELFDAIAASMQAEEDVNAQEIASSASVEPVVPEDMDTSTKDRRQFDTPVTDNEEDTFEVEEVESIEEDEDVEDLEVALVPSSALLDVSVEEQLEEQPDAIDHVDEDEVPTVEMGLQDEEQHTPSQAAIQQEDLEQQARQAEEQLILEIQHAEEERAQAAQALEGEEESDTASSQDDESQDQYATVLVASSLDAEGVDLEDVLTDLRTHRDNLHNLVQGAMSGQKFDVSLLVWSVHTLASLCRSLGQERFRIFCKTIESKTENDIDAQNADVEIPVSRQMMLSRFASVALDKTERLIVDPTSPLEWDEIDESVEKTLAEFEPFVYQDEAESEDGRATEEERMWDEVQSRFDSIVQHMHALQGLFADLARLRNK